ncbi:hypothetical protein JL722_14282 [Aureococcus anophagefferens]|nr:hypothetical protein JL722_14282 [Aureococcus anophagefferens]
MARADQGPPRPAQGLARREGLRRRLGGGEAPPLVPGDRVLVRVAKGAEVLPTPDENWGSAHRVRDHKRAEESTMLIVPSKSQAFDYEAVVLAAGTTDSEVQVKQVGSSHTETLSRNSSASASATKSARRARHAADGRRVLINGVAVAHLGGAFDSIQRHHDIIEIGDESDEDEAPLPAPRKKSRTARFRRRADLVAVAQMDDDDPYVMKSLSMSERAEKIKTMDKDAIASASVLVDGCRMPELEDKDSGRGTGTSWRGIFSEVKSVRECENQHQRLIATATDDYFEVLVTNDQPLALSSEDENLLRFSASHFKTNPKAWQDWQWHQIEEARVASRELRKSLRGGFAVTEPPSYLFSSRLSPLEGAGAPRAVGDAAALDAALRGEGFKLAGEASSFFAACSRQLCGTAGLAGYVERVVVEARQMRALPERREESYTKHEIRQQKDWYFDNEYGRLFRAGKSPIKTKQWLEFARRAARATAMAANQIYDDALARSDDPPPLVPGDHLATMYHEKMAVLQKEKDAKLLVVPTKEQLIDYEAVVLAAAPRTRRSRSSRSAARTETLSRNSKRLGVGASRRGAAVAEMQVEIFAQAFSNVFGVMLYLLMVSGSDKKLRVVRSGDESDEDDAPPAPPPPPRKKSRTSKSAKFKADPGAVKSERRA